MPLDILSQLTQKQLSMRTKPKLLQGTLDMLILKSLRLGPMHGYGIARRIAQLSDDVLTVEEGSLYPAVYRLQQQGWIQSTWDVSENNQRARYYKLTAAGRKQLEREKENWGRLSEAISRVLSTA
jgi:PadR family transcriptional regulator PadR